jgi:hypothetical protein
VVQRVGGLSLVAECAALVERSAEALDGCGIVVAAPEDHAELDQCVACLGAIASCARSVRDYANIGHGALDLRGLSARFAALFVQIELGRIAERAGVRGRELDRAIEPAERLAHGEKLLRALRGEPHVVHGFVPSVTALEVLCEPGVALVQLVVAL